MALELEKAAGGLIRRVQKALGRGSEGASFAALLYGHKGIDSLESLPADWLAENAREGLEFIASKPKGRHKIRVRRVAARKDLPETAVLEILNDDMPFLVDSILGELQARGLAVTLLLHPIFKARRDKNGRLQQIGTLGGADWGDAPQESYIAAHLRALSDKDSKELAAALSAVLDEVRVVVADWKPMLQRLRAATHQLEKAPTGVPRDLLSESVAFLNWLEQGNFTFLGVREFELTGSSGANDPATADLTPVSGSGLGVLRNREVEVLRRGTEMVAMTPEVRRFFFAPAPLIITKANVMSRVHRRAHMDYIGIKTYRGDGTPKGEVRIVGLLTSQAYVRSPGQIPILNHKVASVLAGSGYPPDSHDGKALINILDTFPRDELFQIGVERLREWAEGILDLETRPRVRVFARVDRFDRFVSLLVYVPRDRYTSQTRERIGALLAQAYAGRVSAFYPYFPPEGPLVRVQFIIGRHAGATPNVDVAELERSIAGIVRTWEDRLGDAITAKLPTEVAGDLRRTYGRAFSAGYAENFSAERALEDIKRIERLSTDLPLSIDFYREADSPAHRIHAAIYRFGAPMRLSERVPLLENLGFLAIDERSYHIRPTFADGQRDVTLHDMVLETADGSGIDLKSHDKRLEECFLAVFRGDADNDSFNRLIISAGADWREAAALRSYAAYLRQLGAPFGLRYLADTLNRHAGVSRDLLELFHLRFKPARDAGRRGEARERTEATAIVRQRIEGALVSVPSLDEDRILRWFLNLIDATVRTNFYQPQASGGSSSTTLAFKLDSKAVDAAPQPRPFREIWVYSPRVEGIHLRFAPIARGGIRWSDRAQDFRTEILGLVRAQVVKNAVIVPSGAKGGFLPKLLPRSGSREDIQKEGVAAYSIFISALLDITDNIKSGKVVPPPGVIRHDGDDPYLVVAADKGTATFSDIANRLSEAHGFWLGDAFASGGSAGYDHKKMAITARGAWECVKRHFREMDIDIQSQPFRVVGVGDMSGDVFGNGMLLSDHIQLVAAFDHRDIFIDPTPSAASLAERKRLFDLPRSSWQDYDKAKISKGGGVFSRASKAVPLSDEMRLLLGVDAASLPPNTLINAILKCETDLLWFGGIGTYVRAAAETDAEVGDRANDSVRVGAADLKAKVIGEGANLGVTQRGRIEFAARGGRLNTDSIDNSAGVNTSDQEVNIKVAVAPAVESGKLSLDARNALLTEMTDEVAAASLENNYQQSLALSLAEARSARELADYGLLMRSLQARGLFDRPLEALPSDIELQERARTGRGLARPELAVLLSYAKIALQQDLLESAVPDEPALEPWLVNYFPAQLSQRFVADIRKHSLRREIVALGLTNALLNRGGPAIAVRLAEETSRTTADVAIAFLAAREVFDLPPLWQRIDALDGKLGGSTQLALYGSTQDLVINQTMWFLRNGAALTDLGATIAKHRDGVVGLQSALDAVLPARRRSQLDATTRELTQRGVSADLAGDVARLEVLGLAPSITAIAAEMGASLADAGAAFLSVGEQMSIADITARAAAIATPDHYDRLAIAQALGQLADSQAALTRRAIAAGAAKDVASWLAGQGDRLARVRTTLEEIAGQSTATVSRLLVAAGQLAGLTDALAAPSAAASRGRSAGRGRSAANGTPPARKRAQPSRS